MEGKDSVVFNLRMAYLLTELGFEPDSDSNSLA